MNILFISHLTSNVASGPNWSVPARVQSLSEYDNVLWVNMTDDFLPHWRNVSAYHNIKEYGSLNNIPAPFDNPDLVVFEGFYFISDVFFAKRLYSKGIPYIIVPRGSLTWQALHNKAKIKKYFAHKLFFNVFIKRATIIQYLTESEKYDSTRCFSKESFVVPNGFNEPKQKKVSFSKIGIKASFIGRLGVYHKGIDNLLEAICMIKDELRKAHFTLNMYGPVHKYDYDKVQIMIDKLGISDLVFLMGAVSGEEKEQAILNSDLFILTSRLEGHPMGLIEALAYGLPCLVSKGSNMKDEIDNYNAGWSCIGEAKDIRDTLLLIIKERDQFPMKGTNATKLAGLYDWRLIAKKFHDMVNQLIK